MGILYVNTHPLDLTLPCLLSVLGTWSLYCKRSSIFCRKTVNRKPASAFLAQRDYLQ